jgi:phage/plasmid-associated DNA primase
MGGTDAMATDHLPVIFDPELEPDPVQEAEYLAFVESNPDIIPPDAPEDLKRAIYEVATSGLRERRKKLQEIQDDEAKDTRDVFNAEIRIKLRSEYDKNGGRLAHFTIDEIGNIKGFVKSRVAYTIHNSLNTVAFNNTIYCYDEIGGVYREERGQIASAVRVLCSFEGAYAHHNSMLIEVERQIMSFNVFVEYPFNKKKTIIPVRNGTLHLMPTTKGFAYELRCKSFTDMVTWRIPIDYDISDKIVLTKSKVLELFEQWVDKEKVMSLVRIGSQAIRQTALELPYKRSYLLIGAKDAGKSTYINVLFQLFNRLYSQVPLQLVGSQFKSGEMEGKLLNIKDELSDAEMKNLNPFKDFTGSCRHQIERKGKDGYPGRISAVHVYACNTPPKLASPNDVAHLSRWEIVIFGNIFEREPGWFERVITDDFLKALLLLVIDEALNLIDKGIPVVDEAEVKKIWTQKASEEESEFIRVMLERDPDGLIPCERCYDLYKDYMSQRGKNAKELSSFGRELSKLEVYKARPTIGKKRVRCYTGIRERGSFIQPDRMKEPEQKEIEESP